ncbi:MAG TPA: FHA domain-containing protein, partial [Candidatus Hydrogenedentes bacterium]|nr:FHA domain-containing protein [Candidatus Hydrogenedentota bacterium]
MLLGFLVHEAEGREAERIPVGDLLVIGRGADCDYQIMESSVSRRHVEIRARPGGFYWRDLGSANGTAVNGERLPAGELRHNDRIEVGNATLRFELEEVEGPDEEGPPKDETVFFSETLLAGQPALEPAKADRSEEALRAVCTVMNEIASNYEPCPLLDRILETTMKAIDAQRGAIFFADAAGQELLPCPVCRNIHMIRNGKLVHAEKGGLRISNTVAHRVLRGGETVL